VPQASRATLAGMTSGPRRAARSQGRPTTTPKPPAVALPQFMMPTAAVVAALGLVTLVVQRHALHRFFALDDLILFQQAAGIRPWPLTAWRWLSGWAWFKAVVPLFGHEPFPYHAASLALHLLNTLLLERLARRWGAGPVAAFVGAALFGISRLHFPALLAATSIGEILALTGTLAALLLVGPGPRHGLAIVMFALALSAKESVLLVPLAAWLTLPPAMPIGARVRTLGPLVATGLGLGGALLLAGVGGGRLSGQAYTVSLGTNLFENAARLIGWTVDLRDPIPDLHATTEGVSRTLLPLIAIVLTVLALRARSPALRAGVAWWWLAVLPVLPLPGRTYLHYLYVPLAGAALAIAGLWEAVLARTGRRARSGRGRLRWIVAFGVVLVFAVVSDMLLSVREDLRMSATDWPLDPVLRKSEIARVSIADVRQALNGRRARVAILIPASISHAINLGSGTVASNVTGPRRYELEQVLDEGRSLRAQLPNADSAAFVHDYEPGREGWDYFLSRSDSHLVLLGQLPEAHARFVQAMLASGFPRAALDYADKALADRPDDVVMRALRDQAEAATRKP